jgi:uncharacterized Zn finger protein
VAQRVLRVRGRDVLAPGRDDDVLRAAGDEQKTVLVESPEIAGVQPTIHQRLERDAARSALRRRDLGGLIDALLSDGDPELAWETGGSESQLKPRIASVAAPGRSRETQSPTDALAVYWRVVDNVLQETDRHAYTTAVKILKRARAAAQTANQLDAFTQDIARLGERHHRRRPTLIAMLDKAGLR